MWACLAVVAAVQVQAVDQDAQLQYSTAPLPITPAPRSDDGVWQRFKIALHENAADLFADRFHPFKVMNLTVQLDDRFNEFRERTSKTARYTLLKSSVDAAREATVDLPAMSWLEERGSFIGEFLRNSVGSVEEEWVAPLNPSYGIVERSWWNRLSTTGDIRYGIRPFSTAPYAFFSLGLRQGETLILLGNLRYYYRNLTDHKFEFAMSVPLSYGFSVDVGTSYQFGQHDDERVVLKILKQFKSGGIFHVGFEVRDRPVAFAGVALPW